MAASRAASVASRAAIVTAVGRPRATSVAKLGPDRIAGGLPASTSPAISDIRLPLSRSMPFAQMTFGVPGAISGAMSDKASRSACAGTTESTISAPSSASAGSETASSAPER